MPITISAPHSAAQPMKAVETAVLRSRYLRAPKSWDRMTEQPMLLPNAKAMKISVIS